MGDYYGYAPLLTLAKPLFLCGLPGCEVGPTARVITMVTGLPLVRLRHRVAHVHGTAWDLQVMRDGQAAVLERERPIVEEAFTCRAPPVVALSWLTLQDPALRARILSEGELVVLQVGFDQALNRIATQAGANPRRHAAFRQGEPPDAEHLLPRLRFVARLCRDAHRPVAVGDHSPLRVGREIAEELELRSA